MIQTEALNPTPDYQINVLISKQERHLKATQDRYGAHHRELAYLCARAILMYASRLLFAISWDIIRENTTPEEDSEIYRKLFLREGKPRETDSVEPGEFAHHLDKLVNAQKERGSFKNTDQFIDIKKCVNLLYQMGECRNNHAHILTGFDKLFQEIESIITSFNALFENKVCQYIVPCGEHDDQGNYPAYFLDSERGSMLDPCNVPIKEKWTQREEKLFYRVQDTKSSNAPVYYCLSPFISCINVLDSFENPVFWAYQYSENNGYGGSDYTLWYTKITPTMSKSDRPGQFDDENIGFYFDTASKKFQLSDVFVYSDNLCKENSDVWYPTRCNSKVNVSSYPGFEDVIRAAYLYCEDICDIRKKVLKFCEYNERGQLLYVCGNGGVGKTALLLSIFNQFMNFEMDKDKPVYRFTRLIFFSAKNRFYQIAAEQSPEGKADIQNYTDLLQKLSKLLDVSLCDPFNEDAQAQLLLQAFEKYSGRSQEERFLMVIDDLDSLSTEDQQKIDDFAYKNNNAKVIKTIITTRKLKEETSYCMRIRELDDAKSICYIDWVLNRRQRKLSEKAIEKICEYGKGNPLRLNELINWSVEGMPLDVRVPATQAERNAYLYNTVQNILTDAERTVLEITRRVFEALPKERKGDEINKSLLEYLCAGVDLPEDFNHVCEHLADLKLLTLTKNRRCIKLYDYELILDRNSLNVGSVSSLKKMYRYIFKQIGEADSDTIAEWVNYSTEQTLFDCIVRAKEAPAGIYSGEVAMKINEYMLTKELTSKLHKKIETWIEENSISAGKENIAERLVELIESQWEDLKKVYDDGKDNKSLRKEFDDNRKKLRAMTPSEEILNRLRRINEELNNDYT